MSISAHGVVGWNFSILSFSTASTHAVPANVPAASKLLQRSLIRIAIRITLSDLRFIIEKKKEGIALFCPAMDASS